MDEGKPTMNNVIPAWIATATDPGKLQIARDNALKRDAAAVVVAIDRRIDELKALGSFRPANVAHPVGDYFVQYQSVRGREWMVDVTKAGKFVCEAPVSGPEGCAAGEQRVYFPDLDVARRFAAREDFLVALRGYTGTGNVPPFHGLIRVKPISSPSPRTSSRGKASWTFVARIVETVADNNRRVA
jgi:hypothetical protein